MGSGEHVWSGQFDVFCSANGPPQYSVVDSNDYYNESPQNSSPNFEYGSDALYEKPLYLSTSTGDVNLEATAPDLSGTDPPWGYYDASTLDAATNSLEPAISDPTEAGSPPATITSATWSSGTALVTTTSTSGMWSGEVVAIDGVQPVGYDGNFPIQLVSPTQFSYNLLSSPGSYSSGGTAADAAAPETESLQTLTTYDTWDMAGTTYGSGSGTEQTNLPNVAPPVGSSDMPLLTSSQASGETVATVDTLQQSYGPGANTETYDSSGWARPPTWDRVLCPEPTNENNWGTTGGLPNEAACNSTGAKAYWPGSQTNANGSCVWQNGSICGYWNKKDREPNSSPPNGEIDSAFDEAFCGPGSATEIAYTWDYKKVANYNGPVIDGNKNNFGISKGWYRYFYHEVYRLMRWSHGSDVAFGDGWSTWWGSEMSELNAEVGVKHHFTWLKWGPGAPSTSSPHYLSAQNFRHALRHDLASAYRGNVFTAVYTGYMGNWAGYNKDANQSTPGGTGGWNHYISVSGFNRSADEVEYADTAWPTDYGGTSSGPFGYWSASSGTPVTVTNYLNLYIEQNAVAAKNNGVPVQYFSDRAVVW